MQANLMEKGNVYQFLYKASDGRYKDRVLLVIEKKYGEVSGLDLLCDDPDNCYRKFLLSRIDGNKADEVDFLYVDLKSLPKSISPQVVLDGYRNEGKLAVLHDNAVYVVDSVKKSTPRFTSMVAPYQFINVDGQSYRLTPNGEIAKYPSLAKVTNEEFVKAVVGK